MTYYHITKFKHINSIIAKGIIPGYRRGLCINPGKLKHVYITTDVKRILTTQAGTAWLKRNKIAVFEVDITGLTLEPVKYRDGATYTISDFEFMTDKIEPERLPVLQYTYIPGTTPKFKTTLRLISKKRKPVELRTRLLLWHSGMNSGLQIFDLLESGYQAFRRRVAGRVDIPDDKMDFREAIKIANDEELESLMAHIDEERLEKKMWKRK